MTDPNKILDLRARLFDAEVLLMFMQEPESILSADSPEVILRALVLATKEHVSFAAAEMTEILERLEEQSHAER